MKEPHLKKMAEVLEYAVVVLVSSALAAYSIGVYGGFSSNLGPAKDGAEFASIVALANAAVEHGNASSMIDFSHATVACSARTISFHEGTYSQSSSIPVDCSIEPTEVTGSRVLSFVYTGGSLFMKVR